MLSASYLCLGRPIVESSFEQVMYLSDISDTDAEGGKKAAITKTQQGHFRAPTFATTLQILFFRIAEEEDIDSRSYPDTVADAWVPNAVEHLDPNRANGRAKSIYHIPDTLHVQESTLVFPRAAVWTSSRAIAKAPAIYLRF